jgi:hypothetical protein
VLFAIAFRPARTVTQDEGSLEGIGATTTA